MLTGRQKEILSYLKEDEYVTTSFIASQMDLSDKTIRNELKLIEETLSDVVEINTKPRYGVSLLILDSVGFNEIIGTKRKNDIPDSPKQRVEFICEYLLAHDEYVKIEDLADLLFLSPGSVSQDLKMVREILSQYNLEIVQKPKYGIKIKGSEKDRRLCISHLYQSDDKVIDKDMLSDIGLCLEKVFDKHNFMMSDFSFNNLAVHLYIALKRIEEGNYMPMDEELLNSLKQNQEYELAKDIVKEITSLYDIEMPESECGYVSMHLLGKKTVLVENDLNTVVDEGMMEIVDNMLSVVDEEYNMKLSDDLDLRVSLALHLIPMKSRLEYDMVMRNPLLDEIKSHYMMAFMAATSACSVIKDILKKDIPEDEIGYIALHINLSLEKRGEDNRKKNIVMVCSTGRGTAELLEHQYRRKFGPYINKLITCDCKNVSKVDFSDIDLVISTVPITDPIPVPVIRVKCFLQENDVKSIKKQLNKTGSVSIERFFDKRLFFVNVPAKTREEVIEYMTMRVATVKKVPRNFKELVLLREKKAITEFGNMIAIPHPYKTCTDETFAAIAILKKPILWDKKQVQLVMMVSVARNEKKNLQLFYEVTSRMLMSKQYVKVLLQEKKYSTLMDIFRTIEKEKESE